MYTDSHVHFDGLKDTTENIIKKAADSQVTVMIAVGGTPLANQKAMEVSGKFPQQVFPAAGLDRYLAADSTPAQNANMAENLKQFINQSASGQMRVIAIGEIGLDFYYDKKSHDAQIDLFRRQLALAEELCLPVIVHSRDAEVQTICALEEHRKKWQGDPSQIGVLHCFTGNPEFAKKLQKLDYHISFSGIVTFKKAENVRESLQVTRNNRLLIETDSPYLAPVPHRGKPNEPAYVTDVAKAIVDHKGIPVESLAQITSNNARNLFSLT